MISIVKKGNVLPVFSMFDEFMDNFITDEMKNKSNLDSSCSMPLDIHENDKEYLILADLPGIKKEDIKISFHKSQLILDAVSQTETVSEKDKIHHRERFCGNYHRVIQLPEHIDSTKISAKMLDGVLTVNIPKAEEKKQNYINIE